MDLNADVYIVPRTCVQIRKWKHYTAPNVALFFHTRAKGIKLRGWKLGNLKKEAYLHVCVRCSIKMHVDCFILIPSFINAHLFLSEMII